MRLIELREGLGRGIGTRAELAQESGRLFARFSGLEPATFDIYVVRLIIEDELVLRPFFGIGLRVEGLDRFHFIGFAEKLVMSEHGDSHATGGLQETTSREPQFLGALISHHGNPRLPARLLQSLRWRDEFLVRANLGGDWRLNEIVFIGEAFANPHSGSFLMVVIEAGRETRNK